MSRGEPQTPLGRVAKEAARFGWDAYDMYEPVINWEEDEWGENGFSMEIQNEAPPIMWDNIAKKIIEEYRESMP